MPYFSWISFSFGRLSPMVVTVKSPVSIEGLDGLHHRGLESCFLYFASHGAFSSKYSALSASFSMSVVSGLSVTVTKALRAALHAARVAIDLDETVVEIHCGVVLYPGVSKSKSRRIAGLVVADESGDRRGLRGIG